MKLFYVFLIFLLPSCSSQKHKKIDTKNYQSKGEFTLYDEAPVAIVPIQPYYPEPAKQAGIEGTVFVNFYVDEKGYVSNAEIIKKSKRSDLDEAAVYAVKKSKWKPAQNKGKPVGVWLAVPVKFNID